MNKYSKLLFVLLIIFSITSCKKKAKETYGDPAYFVKVMPISLDGEYRFRLDDTRESLLLSNNQLTDDLYPDSYKIRSGLPVVLNVLDWANYYLYWDSDLVSDEEKESLTLNFDMDSDKKFRVLMSKSPIEKKTINVQVPIGTSVYVQNKTSSSYTGRTYIDVFTNDGKLAFLKGMTVSITATNSEGNPISQWSITEGGMIKQITGTEEYTITSIIDDYNILPTGQ